MNEFVKSLIRIKALIKKEFIAMLMDKGTRMVLILPVLVQSIIFGYVANFTPERVQYVILDDSNTLHSKNLVMQISNSPRFEVAAKCADIECLRKNVSSGEALIGIYFGPNFVRDHQILIISDARNTTSANAALGFVQSVVSTYNAANFTAGAIDINLRYLFNENNYTRYTIMIGMILSLSMIQVLMLSAFSVSREREDGTFDMMLMTPTNPIEILIGKAIAPIIVAILQGLALFCVCKFYFQIPFRGNFGELFTLIALFSTCNVGIGLAISALCKTSLQSIVSSYMVILPSIMISGLLTPIDAMPQWFWPLAYIDPMYYANNCIWRIYLEGARLGELIHLIVPMIIIGAGTMSLAASLFRSKLD